MEEKDEVDDEVIETDTNEVIKIMGMTLRVCTMIIIIMTTTDKLDMWIQIILNLDNSTVIRTQ